MGLHLKQAPSTAEAGPGQTTTGTILGNKHFDKKLRIYIYIFIYIYIYLYIHDLDTYVIMCDLYIYICVKYAIIM